MPPCAEAAFERVESEYLSERLIYQLTVYHTLTKYLYTRTIINKKDKLIHTAHARTGPTNK